MSTLTDARFLPPVASPMTPREPVYRLTRRGRLVVLVVALFAVLAIGVAFAGVSLASEEPEATETIVVAPGDTLWDLSSDLSTDGDVRAMMRHIQELNALDSVALGVGQQLQVPVEG